MSTKKTPKEAKSLPVVIRREPLTDAQKFQAISLYAQGMPLKEITEAVARDSEEAIKNVIQDTLRSMTAVRETNELIKSTCSSSLKRFQGKTPAKFITDSFLKALDEKAEIYAYYFAQTGDNKFSLIQSGLDIGIAPTLKVQLKDYIYRIRGQYLRDLPPVKKFILEEQNRRISEYHLEKAQIQMELVNQIEELKEATVYDARQRTNLLKSIELLGRTIGAFTDRVEVEEADTKSGLDILLKKARSEISVGSYSIEDAK